MASRHIIYKYTVASTFGGDVVQSSCDYDQFRYTSAAGRTMTYYILSEYPLKKYQLYMLVNDINETALETLSSFVSDAVWAPGYAKCVYKSNQTSTPTPWNSTYNAYTVINGQNFNVASGTTIKPNSQVTAEYHQMFWFTDDDPTFEQVAAIADGVHVLTDEMCWLTWYSTAQSKIVLSRLNFPEMTDPLDPYTKWWIVGDSSPTRFAFPKMYMYSQTDSNIYEGNKKIKDFYVGDDKVLAIYLGDTKVMG